MLFQVIAAAGLLVNDPSLKAVKLPAEAPFAVLLNQVLPLAAHQGDASDLDTQVTKKAFIAEPGANDGYLITCVTSFPKFSRAPQPVGHFLGCQIEVQDDAEAGVTTLSFKALTLKLGGKPILGVPNANFCHTRAC